MHIMAGVMALAVQAADVAPARATSHTGDAKQGNGTAAPSASHTQAPALAAPPLTASALQQAAHTLPGLPAEIQAAYAARGWKPYWMTSQASQADRIADLTAALTQAEAHGLTLPALHGSQTESPATYELTLSWAAATMARALSYGALTSPASDAERVAPPSLASLLDQVASAASPGSNILHRVPQTPLYTTMLAALAKSREVAARESWPKVPTSGKLTPGDDAAEVPDFRRRLAASNAYHADDATMASTLYDETLAAAIKVFQDEHGLEPDGVIGKSTREALNMSPAMRVDQLKANLDRLRWLPDHLSDRYLLVNIAGFEAWLFNKGAVEMSTPVIVGKDQQQTPSFSNAIRSVEFNPSWEVPRSIAMKEILPKLAKDHGYLAKEDMEVYEGWENGGQVINPDSVDWASLARNDRLPYRFRQKPGPKNSLGRVKLLFPNSYDVYLHDTPSRGLFNRRVRAFSHGCMRVGKPLELASVVLGMPLDKVQEAVSSGKQIRHKVTDPLPIHITYLTSWADPGNGAIRYGSDVYGRDAALIAQFHPAGKSSDDDLDSGILKARAVLAHSGQPPVAETPVAEAAPAGLPAVPEASAQAPVTDTTAPPTNAVAPAPAQEAPAPALPAAGAPKADAQKAAAPQAEAQKVDPPKAEPPKAAPAQAPAKVAMIPDVPPRKVNPPAAAAAPARPAHDTVPTAKKPPEQSKVEAEAVPSVTASTETVAASTSPETATAPTQATPESKEGFFSFIKPAEKNILSQ
ncbi:Murein L,D-transpeptidase YcbB/YkuD [Insolitispirillum peregrinum]|uniref:Murein L,D-transpeptidase YcbB/YkuD n=2 Tax=Insolitispirillum peregrinum TaxID=80876 RepID=A0A1N7NJX8_9PROT|nr:Murein L,D-transpeptidase YcbB/YkuD [Insolitispirillum peregrinum]